MTTSRSKPARDEWRPSAWTAYVTEGADRDARRARIEEVPAGMRDAVRSAVVFYFYRSRGK